MKFCGIFVEIEQAVSILLLYSFNSGFLTGRVNGLSVQHCMQLAQKTALTSLTSVEAVPQELELLRLH
uniref:Secreted protein n=1 Tax=Syphacia muris TaxID=451379 RepID=A0A0N5AT94_9BILA